VNEEVDQSWTIVLYRLILNDTKIYKNIKRCNWSASDNCSAHDIWHCDGGRWKQLDRARKSARKHRKTTSLLSFCKSSGQDPDKIQTESSLVVSWHFYRKSKFSRAATPPLDNVARKWVIGFRRKIPEQEADGVSGKSRRRLSPFFFLRRLAFHPASHLPLTLNQSFRADKVSQPLSKVSRCLEESRGEKPTLPWPTITSL